MKWRRTAATWFTVGALLLGSYGIGNASDFSVEPLYGFKGSGGNITTLENKASGDLCSKVKYRLKNRVSIDHDKNHHANSFTLTDIVYELGKGFAVVSEMQVFENTYPELRTAIEWNGSLGDFWLYLFASQCYGKKATTEFYPAFGYEPKLGKDLSLVATQEIVVRTDNHDYVFDIYRTRVGVDYKGTTLGLGLDMSGMIHGDFSYFAGPFIKKRF